MSIGTLRSMPCAHSFAAPRLRKPAHTVFFYFHSFQVHAPQVMAQTTQTEAVAIVAAVAPKRSESRPAARLEMLMVRVTSP